MLQINLLLAVVKKLIKVSNLGKARPELSQSFCKLDIIQQSSSNLALLRDNLLIFKPVSIEQKCANGCKFDTNFGIGKLKFPGSQQKNKGCQLLILACF